MSGGMVCMSRALAVLLASDEHFGRFRTVAAARNTAATPCRAPTECAKQPVASHLWHHEDAGMGYNVFRAAAVARGPPLAAVALGRQVELRYGGLTRDR
mgnify:CR=1 FL=1